MCAVKLLIIFVTIYAINCAIVESVEVEVYNEIVEKLQELISDIGTFISHIETKDMKELFTIVHKSDYIAENNERLAHLQAILQKLINNKNALTIARFGIDIDIDLAPLRLLLRGRIWILETIKSKTHSRGKSNLIQDLYNLNQNIEARTGELDKVYQQLSIYLV